MQLHLDDSEDHKWREVLPHDGSAKLLARCVPVDVADEMFRRLLDEVPWQSHDLVLFGKQITEPRLSAWIGDEGAAYTYSGVRRLPGPWTPTLVELRHLCESHAVDFASNDSGQTPAFNSVLANLYRSGDDSMGWHADDEPELATNPVIASLSFGDERRFDFKHRVSGDSASILLPHGSLLVMSGETQMNWKHRIARTKSSKAPRINLTFRFVRSSTTTS
ncbi:MAG: alpha-ketoglutarate-dependent dioxygenase AlkB family protein [Ilumatobacteraceae bacterium]